MNGDLRDLRKKGEIYKGQDVGDAGLNTSDQNAANRWNAKYGKQQDQRSVDHHKNFPDLKKLQRGNESWANMGKIS